MPANPLQSQRVVVNLDVPEGAERVRAWPVTFGVPFPRGRLFRRDRVRVADAQGRAVAAQFEVLSRWHADQSIFAIDSWHDNPKYGRMPILDALEKAERFDRGIIFRR